MSRPENVIPCRVTRPIHSFAAVKTLRKKERKKEEKKQKYGRRARNARVDGFLSLLRVFGILSEKESRAQRTVERTGEGGVKTKEQKKRHDPPQESRPNQIIRNYSPPCRSFSLGEKHTFVPQGAMVTSRGPNSSPPAPSANTGRTGCKMKEVGRGLRVGVGAHGSPSLGKVYTPKLQGSFAIRSRLSFLIDRLGVSSLCTQ